MTRWSVVVVVVALSLAVATAKEERVDYEGAQLLRVIAPHNDTRRAKLAELQDQDAVEEWHQGSEEVDVFVTKEKLPQVKELLDQSQLEYKVIIENIQQAIDTENPPLSDDELNLAGRKAKRRWCRTCPPALSSKYCCVPGPGRSKGHRMTWQYYHRLDDIYGYMDYLAQTYPSFVSVQTIGNSVEGRPLKVLKISSSIPNQKSLWVDGGTHAREWISPASTTYIMNQLVENRDNHLETVQGLDYYIMPVVNPDGYEHSHLVDRLWRKNRARNARCTGTDLNRNWGYKWGGAGSSTAPCKEVYGGAKPFSEPETLATSTYILANKANMKGFLTFHSYGQYVLYPWGYDRKVPPDHTDLQRVGRLMGAAMYKQNGNHRYTVGPSAATLYAAAGGADDWAKGQAGIKYSYTIELPDTGRYGFLLPAAFIQPCAKEALAAVKVLAQEIRNTP